MSHQPIYESMEYRKAEAKLRTLFEPVKFPRPGGETPTSHKLFLDHCKEFYNKWKEAQNISNILKNLKTEITYNDEKVKSMSKMLAYMGLVESLGVTLIEMVLFLLIINKREIHTRGHLIKHVTNFEELGQLDLSDKIEFLKSEGISLFNLFINREVRNIIAHLKFTINGSGEIRRKSNHSLIDIDNFISKFWEGVNAIERIFTDIGLICFLESNCT